MHPYGFLIHSVEASCAFVWPVASALLLSHICLCRSAWSRHTHVIRIHNTAIYESVFCGFRCYLFARLYCMISKWIIEGWEIKTDEHEKRKTNKQTSCVAPGHTSACVADGALFLSFFLPLHLCFSGLYRFCFSRSDGCGFLKASTHRPKNCSVTMGTGVNQEFIKARGFQFTTGGTRTHVRDSIPRPVVSGEHAHAWKTSFELGFFWLRSCFVHTRSCVHRFQTSLVSQLDSPNPTCNLWMYLHLHKLKQKCYFNVKCLLGVMFTAEVVKFM